MTLKEIEIHNFHCYKEASFQLADRVNVLIGKNGSGKTSFVKSIKNALSIFFSQNLSWGYSTIAGGVNDLTVANLDCAEIWHDEDMQPADAVDIKVTASVEDCQAPLPAFPSWSFHKLSTANAKLQSSLYKDAYLYFRTEYIDNNMPWPLFAYYSDRYPHIDAKLSQAIQKMIDNDDKLYRAWGYYHWDKDSSCALIWQKRFMRTYNLQYKRRQSLSRIADQDSAEAQKCREDIEKYASETDFVLKFLQKFTSSQIEGISDLSNTLQISDIITDGISEPYLVVYFADGSRRRWDELPAGYERLYNIVFDIAYRSYILNGASVEPQGIVLIDELDLHLHPSMEQDVLIRFMATFERMQFIVSTHSPLVISNTMLGKNGKIILLQHEDGEYGHTYISDKYGSDYEFVLSAIMNTEPRNVKLEQLKGKYLRLMRRGKDSLAEATLQAIHGLGISDERYRQIEDELRKELQHV